MKQKLFYLFLSVLLVTCNQGTEELDKVTKDDVITNSRRIVVTKTSSFQLTMSLPEAWQVLHEQGRWMAKVECSDEFCANIVYYHNPKPSVGVEELVNALVQELKATYGPSFELISTSPIYENPTQFSIAYAFGKEGIYLTGYTYVVLTESDLHIFEVLDDYKNADEVEDKLERASQICGSLQVEKY
jgi:hypothetical protein